MYSVFRFEVTPATVVAFLTILGFSLYDTIVVFDKVNENTDRFAGARVPYADVINVSMNQVLMRSINTSLAAVLPVLSLLILGSGILGAVTLREFALALLVGLLTGSYSSIFIAAPLLAMFKEREPRYRTVRTAARHRRRARAPGARRLARGASARRLANVTTVATERSSCPRHQHSASAAHPSAAATEEEASHQLKHGIVTLYGIEWPLAQRSGPRHRRLPHRA